MPSRCSVLRSLVAVGSVLVARAGNAQQVSATAPAPPQPPATAPQPVVLPGKFVSVYSTRLYYQEAGSGPTVILLAASW
jgi:hypothetical protein